MKRFFSISAALVILAGTGAAIAQPRHDDHDTHDMHDTHGPAMHAPSMQGPSMKGLSMGMRGPSHPNWHTGGRIERGDWNRGSRVDYRARHLRQPPRGYEWRQVDGNYVLAAAATGLIASIILANQ